MGQHAFRHYQAGGKGEKKSTMEKTMSSAHTTVTSAAVINPIPIRRAIDSF